MVATSSSINLAINLVPHVAKSNCSVMGFFTSRISNRLFEMSWSFSVSQLKPGHNRSSSLLDITPLQLERKKKNKL